MVTAEMAERGVGEAGRVVVAESIPNKLVHADLLRADKRAQKNRNPLCPVLRRCGIGQRVHCVLFCRM